MFVKRPVRVASRWDVVPTPEAARFQAIIRPYCGELLAIARSEILLRIERGELDAHDVTAEEILEGTLLLAWRTRRRRPHLLTTRTWLLVLLFRLAESLVQRQVRLSQRAEQTLLEDEPAGAILDDDEELWEWFQPNVELRPSRMRMKAHIMAPPGFEAALQSLDRVARQALVTAIVYRLPARAVAAVLRIPESEAALVLVQARRSARVALIGSDSVQLQQCMRGMEPGAKAPCAHWPPAGPHARPHLINPLATPGTGALPSCGVDDEVDPSVD